MTHIVSQSDMLQFLYKHRARLGNTLLGSTLRQVRPGFCAAKFGAPLAVLTPGTGGLAPTSFCIRMPLQLGVQERQVLCVPAELAVIDALAGMVDARVPGECSLSRARLCLLCQQAMLLVFLDTTCRLVFLDTTCRQWCRTAPWEGGCLPASCREQACALKAYWLLAASSLH